MNFFKDLSLSSFTAGFVAVLVGFTSSVAIVFQAAQAFQATPAQITSWMWALGLGMGLCSAIPSLILKKPVMVAWSTPGAAVLATAGLADRAPVDQDDDGLEWSVRGIQQAIQLQTIGGSPAKHLRFDRRVCSVAGGPEQGASANGTLRCEAVGGTVFCEDLVAQVIGDQFWWRPRALTDRPDGSSVGRQ